jgi:hypothetical protein
MPYEPGHESPQRELLKLQLWAKPVDTILFGKDGDEGMVGEWRDFSTTRRNFGSFAKGVLWFIVFLAGVPATLVALSALGFIHLR